MTVEEALKIIGTPRTSYAEEYGLLDSGKFLLYHEKPERLIYALYRHHKYKSNVGVSKRPCKDGKSRFMWFIFPKGVECTGIVERN